MSDRLKRLTSGFIMENPVFDLYLGICSTLAITTSLNNALGMGLSLVIVLTCSNMIISAIRNIVPDEIRIPVFIVIIASLVTMVSMFLHAYAISLYSALGAFLDLIVVNCIILGRAESYASKNGILDSAIDGIGMGLGYTFALCLMALTRQILGTGVLSLMNPFNEVVLFNIRLIPEAFTIPLFTQTAGAFLTFACWDAIFNAYKNNLKKKQAEEEQKENLIAAVKEAK
ncbi:MAG: electron transport complex subunit RsxE [Erysipelotrichaceae bacterium]|nr:electron transport complex subunit RsxE [Erysipelotrichaceae bacterium]